MDWPAIIGGCLALCVGLLLLCAGLLTLACLVFLAILPFWGMYVVIDRWGAPQVAFPATIARKEWYESQIMWVPVGVSPMILIPMETDPTFHLCLQGAGTYIWMSVNHHTFQQAREGTRVRLTCARGRLSHTLRPLSFEWAA